MKTYEEHFDACLNLWGNGAGSTTQWSGMACGVYAAWLWLKERLGEFLK